MTMYVANLLIYSPEEKIPKVVSKREVKRRSSLTLTSNDLWHVTAEAESRVQEAYKDNVPPFPDILVIAYGKKRSKRFKVWRVRKRKVSD